jgi:beta-galactosidase
MFFERNIAVDFPSARELTAENLRRYALVIVPCPILMTADMAAALEQYAEAGGHLFVEARPGWQDERGHASPVLPGFGWDRLLGVRETEVLPAKQVSIDWGGRAVVGMGIAERFEVLDPSARVIARFADGAPAAFERVAGRGRAIILGTFAGERNAPDPVVMNPLGDLLVDWAGSEKPSLTSSAFVELKRLAGPAGEMVLLFNHGSNTAHVKLDLALAREPRTVREIVTGARIAPVRAGSAGASLRLDADIPAERARVYRIDY